MPDLVVSQCVFSALVSGDALGAGLKSCAADWDFASSFVASSAGFVPSFPVYGLTFPLVE